jgi:hypothetical protein
MKTVGRPAGLGSQPTCRRLIVNAQDANDVVPAEDQLQHNRDVAGIDRTQEYGFPLLRQQKLRRAGVRANTKARVTSSTNTYTYF